MDLCWLCECGMEWTQENVCPSLGMAQEGMSHVVGSRAETALQKFAWSWNVFRVCERRAERAERRKRKKLDIERASRRPARAMCHLEDRNEAISEGAKWPGLPAQVLALDEFLPQKRKIDTTQNKR